MFRQSPGDVIVRLGAYDFGENADASSEDYDVANLRIHPQYDRRTHYNDLAIITLTKRAQFTDAIRPICLPQRGRTYADALATVTGWGSTEYGGPSSKKLRQVTIPVWNS